MKNLETIANELFNKIRGRYPSITVGDMDATITNAPKEARFFEFNFAKDKKVSISLDEKDLTILPAGSPSIGKVARRGYIPVEYYLSLIHI